MRREEAIEQGSEPLSEPWPTDRQYQRAGSSQFPPARGRTRPTTEDHAGGVGLRMANEALLAIGTARRQRPSSPCSATVSQLTDMELGNDRAGGRATAIALVAVLVAAACQMAVIPPSAPSTEALPDLPPAGRSLCADGVRNVIRRVEGGAATALERLQAAYENTPGFIAVVHDGAKPIIVVDAALLSEWRARIAPSGVTVASTCVDRQLLATVKAALSEVRRPPNGTAAAGYDALDDAIVVEGVELGELLEALRQLTSSAETAALEAIAAGTLRLDEQPLHVSRWSQ